jgi:hypothetical protein
MLGPKTAAGEEVFGGLLQDGVSKATIPFSPGRH